MLKYIFYLKYKSPIEWKEEETRKISPTNFCKNESFSHPQWIRISREMVLQFLTSDKIVKNSVKSLYTIGLVNDNNYNLNDVNNEKLINIENNTKYIYGLDILKEVTGFEFLMS